MRRHGTVPAAGAKYAPLRRFARCKPLRAGPLPRAADPTFPRTAPTYSPPQGPRRQICRPRRLPPLLPAPLDPPPSLPAVTLAAATPLGGRSGLPEDGAAIGAYRRHPPTPSPQPFPAPPAQSPLPRVVDPALLRAVSPDPPPSLRAAAIITTTPGCRARCCPSRLPAPAQRGRERERRVNN